MELLIQNVNQTFEREPEGADASTKVVKEDENDKTKHDTEGWKTLETSMRSLQNLIEGSREHIHSFDLQPVLEIILKSVDHINRFVREISYFVIDAIFISSRNVLSSPQEELKEGFRKTLSELVPIVQKGLADNWSQVRYAASQGTRSLYEILDEQ